MKQIIKFVVGAAIASALVNMLLKQRSGRRLTSIPELQPAFDENATSGGFSIQELAGAAGNGSQRTS